MFQPKVELNWYTLTVGLKHNKIQICTRSNVVLKARYAKQCLLKSVFNPRRIFL